MQCRWFLRAGRYAQELPSTFGNDLGEVKPGTGGIFQVHVDGALVWDRAAQGGFPEAKELKLVRDHIDPERSLSHADR